MIDGMIFYGTMSSETSSCLFGDTFISKDTIYLDSFPTGFIILKILIEQGDIEKFLYTDSSRQPLGNNDGKLIEVNGNLNIPLYGFLI